jgi:hypothetical protein
MNVTIDLPTDADQKKVQWLGDRYLVTVQSRRNSSSYVVHIQADENGVDTAFKCNCKHGQFRKGRRPTCYHTKIAELTIKLRNKAARVKALELWEAAELAGWSASTYRAELARQANITQDNYQAVTDLELELERVWGIQRH